eukprot:3681083-Rhodomonas_salina.1
MQHSGHRAHASGSTHSPYMSMFHRPWPGTIFCIDNRGAGVRLCRHTPISPSALAHQPRPPKPTHPAVMAKSHSIPLPLSSARAGAQTRGPHRCANNWNIFAASKSGQALARLHESIGRYQYFSANRFFDVIRIAPLVLISVRPRIIGYSGYETRAGIRFSRPAPGCLFVRSFAMYTRLLKLATGGADPALAAAPFFAVMSILDMFFCKECRTFVCCWTGLRSGALGGLLRHHIGWGKDAVPAHASLRTASSKVALSVFGHAYAALCAVCP